MRLGVQAALVEGELLQGDVEVLDGLVAAVGLPGGRAGTALPGLVDLQVNGFGGIDLLEADAEGVLELAQRLLETGVTAFQPTLITSPPKQTCRALRAIGEAASHGDGALILGVQLEGPFLSPARVGAHPVEELKPPDLGLLHQLLDAGPVSAVTLAPELPGALELIDELVGRGVCVSLGHTDATAAEAAAAFDRGARTVTHLFNAMRPFAHRDPGIAGAALAREDVVIQLIVDGAHLAPETVLAAWHAGRGRFAIVSDSIAAAGLGDGSYRIGNVEVQVEAGVSRGPEGQLAGSVGTLAAGVRRLCELGVPLEEAVDAASRIPARVLGRGDLGRLAPGARADIVVVDDALEVQTVLRNGEPAG
jgi:N-acetylglucosamine-6-phosphate deacetylase